MPIRGHVITNFATHFAVSSAFPRRSSRHVFGFVYKKDLTPTLNRLSGLFYLASIQEIIILHTVSEDEYQLPVLSNNNPVNQRHKGIWIKSNAFLLLLQHAQEHLNPPPAVSLILFLILDAANLLTEFFMLCCQCIVLSLILFLIPSHPGVLFDQLPDTLRHA